MNKAGVLKLQGEEDDIMWRKEEKQHSVVVGYHFRINTSGRLENDMADGQLNLQVKRGKVLYKALCRNQMPSVNPTNLANAWSVRRRALP